MYIKRKTEVDCDIKQDNITSSVSLFTYLFCSFTGFSKILSFPAFILSYLENT